MTIREMRIAQGATQQEMADRCGVTLNTWNAWEVGKTHPQPRMYPLIARELKASPSAVVKAIYDKEVS